MAREYPSANQMRPSASGVVAVCSRAERLDHDQADDDRPGAAREDHDAVATVRAQGQPVPDEERDSQREKGGAKHPRWERGKCGDDADGCGNRNRACRE